MYDILAKLRLSIYLVVTSILTTHMYILYYIVVSAVIRQLQAKAPTDREYSII